MADAFSMFLGAVIGRAVGAAGVRGGVSFGDTLGRLISTGVNGGDEKKDGGKIPEEVKSLIKQPLHMLMPNLPKTAYQPVLQGGQYFATNERGETVGEGFKNVLDALKHMDDLILAQRAQFISAKSGVPLIVNEAGELVRGGGGGGSGGRGWSAMLSSLLSGAGRGGAAASAGATGSAEAGAAAAGTGGAAVGASGGGAAAAVANPVVAIAAAAVAIGAAAAIAPFAIKNWTDSLLHSREELRRFNGQINIAFARYEREEILRKRESAFATSGTTSALAESVSGLKDELRPIGDAAVTFFNAAGVALTELAKFGVMVAKHDPYLRALLAAANKIEENTREQKSALWHTFIDDLAGGKFTGMQRDRRQKIVPPMPALAGGGS